MNLLWAIHLQAVGVALTSAGVLGFLPRIGEKIPRGLAATLCPEKDAPRCFVFSIQKMLSRVSGEEFNY
jgi:hypothetical protein